MKCTNCGAELRPGDKFCTKCGAKVETSSTETVESNNVNTNNQVKSPDLQASAKTTGQSKNWNQTQSQPTMNQNNNANQVPPVQQQGNGNATVDSLKQNSMGYFNWLKQTISKPSEIEDGGTYYGIISIVIHALVLALSIYVVGSQVLSAIAEALGDFLTLTGSSSQPQINVTFSFYLKSFFAMLILFAVFVLVGYVCKKYMTKTEESITGYINAFANYSNTMIIPEVILALYLLIAMPGDVSSLTQSASGLMIFLTILLTAIFSIFVVAYVLSIYRDSIKTKLDKIYVAAIGLFISNVIVYLIFKMFIQSLFSSNS